MTPAPGDRRLYRWEKAGLAAFALLVLAYGVVTEIRSAFLTFQRTDFNVYAHVGWAVRNGENIYGTTTDGGLHYTYPAPFALFMVPFAYPPPAAGPNDGSYLPFAASVAIWYVLSVVFLAWAVHLFAGAVLPDAARGSRRWWYARTVPVYACIGGVGFSLGRGQANLMLVAIVAAAFAAAVRGRRYASGAWLAAAAVIKLIPAYLFLYPAARRDWRAGVGVAAGLVVGLGVIPVAFWGPEKALAHHEWFVRYVVLAGTRGDGDHPLGKDLTQTTATDSQSFQAAIHHVLHADKERVFRPPHASRETRLAHWAIVAVLTGATLWATRRRLTDAPADQLLFLGALSALMTLATPVSHMHYYAFVLPLTAGVWLKGVSLRPGAAVAGPGATAALVVWGLLTALPLFPGPFFERVRECGLGAAATVGLWAVGLGLMGQTGRAAVATAPGPVPARKAA
ncbi:MAG: DUF2029 domain-containing protein [Gemmataceae bacterium]|nr:DUF2029 domain-containing protein [Gemmataceae bacterium]